MDSPASSQRAEQKEQTRLRIIAAAIALMKRGDAEAVTMRGVARMVGVTERTVYRHFASRETLLKAVETFLLERVEPGPLPRTAAELIDRPRRQFPRYDREPELMRAILRQRDRRDMTPSNKRALQTTMFNCARDALEHMDGRTIRWRAAIAQVITSPQTWRLLERNWGFDGEEAGEAAAQALEILFDRRLPY